MEGFVETRLFLQADFNSSIAHASGRILPHKKCICLALKAS